MLWTRCIQSHSLHCLSCVRNLFGVRNIHDQSHSRPLASDESRSFGVLPKTRRLAYDAAFKLIAIRHLGFGFYRIPRVRTLKASVKLNLRIKLSTVNATIDSDYDAVCL